MLNLFGPALIEEFGWQRSQFALVGTLSLVTLGLVPFAGRFIDRVGPRTAAMIGFVAVPLAFLAYSQMTGSIWQFYAITVIKNVFGVLTTSLVFCRVVVERFDAARGMALSIAMTGAPLVGAIGVPLVGMVVDSEGWRTGYMVLAAMSATGGLAAVLLIGRRRTPVATGAQDEARADPGQGAWQVFLSLVRQPSFLLIVGGMFLVNFPMVIVTSQLKLVVSDSGASSNFANWLISLYGISVVIGRFICGFALDRVPPHLVAFTALSLPAAGLVGIASGADTSVVLVACVGLIGLAQGAEGDIGAYLTSRKFDLRHYSFVYSFLIASMGLASASGSIALSYTLHLTDSYDTFLLIAAAATVAGAFLFYLTGRVSRAEAPAPQAA